MSRRTRRASARSGDGPDGRVVVASPPSRRIEGIDALRGFAILAMIVYHFCFDLRHFGVTRADFENDPFWLGARALIATSFLTLVGVSLVLWDRAGRSWPSFWRRIALIAGCAIAVSAGSALMFPRTFIYFGILHCIAVASVLAAPLVRNPRAAVAIGIAVVAAGLLFAHPAFDARWLSWVGFTTAKPATEDFVPLFPWGGVVLIGIGLGHLLAARASAPASGLSTTPRALGALGRHSLLVYMVHQPIMIGALWLLLGR